MINTRQKKIWYAPYMKQAYGDEEIKAVLDCLEDGWLAPGPRTSEFEKKVSELFGKKYGVMVNSGSSANLLALASIGLKEGDEVITPACTFATTVAPIIQLNATPVFCDVEIPKYVPSVERVMACITDSTKAIMLPNLIGIKPDWKRLRKEIEKINPNIFLIEDSCDTISRTEDTDISTTSFYASHVITAGGGGGMVMFNSKKLRDKAIMIRDWGRIGDNCEDIEKRFQYKIDDIPYDYKFMYGELGYNLKSTEMNAAFGLAQLSKLPKFKSIRKMNMNHYFQLLKDKVDGLVLPELDFSTTDELLAMPLLHPQRDRLIEYLEENNVQTRLCFAGNITRHPAFRKYYKKFPNSDRIMKEGFLLGGHHGLNLHDIEYVCDLLLKFKS